MTTPNAEDERPPLDLGSYLWACVSTRREENEEDYLPPEGDTAVDLHRAFDGIEKYAENLVTRGTIPTELDDALAHFMPGDALPTKLAKLLNYNIVQERLQFDVAESVVPRLDDLPKRLTVTIMAFILLQRSRLVETATKYLERASTLFLAGYNIEVSIMCGAVLESAMSARFPDELLKSHHLRPVYARSGVFSLGQRMQFEEKTERVLRDDQRKTLWELVRARNDAIHVQPELASDPSRALLLTAWLLPAILPNNG